VLARPVVRFDRARMEVRVLERAAARRK